MKSELQQILVCPRCHHHLENQNADQLFCPECGNKFRVVEGKPFFTNVPATIEPWEKIERGPDKGTVWRRSNWQYLNEKISKLPVEAKILDVGAGHGDFADIFEGRHYFSLDIFPYAEVDLVVDLAQECPFAEGTFDVVVLMNVLEHVYENRELIKNIGKVLRPGGQLIITVPFLLKVHQAPFDFSRYTPYYLTQLAEESGFLVKNLDGYFDTLYLLNESLGNLWQYSIQPNGLQSFIAKGLVFTIQRLINVLGKLIEPGKIRPYAQEANPAPVGYLMVLEKKA